MNKKYILAIVCLLFSLGCQNIHNTLSESPTVKEVSFISFPAGAVIDIDGVYKGRTPQIITLKEYREKDGDATSYKVFIYPAQDEGYCMQRAILDPYHIPRELSFDLTQCNEQERPPVLPNGNLGVHPDAQTF